MIHSTTVHVEERLHVQAIGFTTSLMLFCWGADATSAADAATAYCVGLGLTPTRTEPARVSQQQDHRRYTFTEQIVALPDSLARETITSRGYPDSMVAETLATLTKRQATLALGRERTCSV